MSKMGLVYFDHMNQMVTLTVMTLSGFHFFVNSNIFLKLKIYFYHLERICLDEHGLSEGTVRRFCHADALPGQSLNDSPVVQVVEVRVGVQVRQGHAVQLGIGQGTNDVRL